MKNRIFIYSIILGLLSLPIGCAGPSRVEMDYGTSFKLATFNQTLNPEAEKNLDPVTGLDGVKAKTTIERYQKDSEKPTAQTKSPTGLSTSPAGSTGISSGTAGKN